MVLAANGVWIWTIVAIIIWIAIAFWPARVAGPPTASASKIPADLSITPTPLRLSI